MNDALAATVPDGGAVGTPVPTPRHYGRFEIVGVLGSGGMGVVLTARDPDLDRHVAIKVLHPALSADPAAAARLAREARAMARLAHPNVVTVYEVGTLGERVFVAMEQVEGATLRAWMAAARTWRAVVAMFVQAGRGLAAAHGAGLVHRDFKPDNVLVGADGRPRVTDFGLVRDDRSDGDGDRSDRGETDDRARGALAGTPAYMAPECWRGGAAEAGVDARSDQFAFCVALWEALHGARPFAGDDVAALRRAIVAGTIAAPARARALPRWLDASLRRGLAVDPAARWPDLTALLDYLERRRRRRGWGIAVATGLLGAGLAAGAAWGLAPAPAPAIDPCAPVATAMDEVWSPAVAAALGTTFAASQQRFAAAALREVSRQLDGWQRDWRAMQHASCTATRVHGEQSDAMMDLRAACLDRRRIEVGAFVDQLRHADRDGVRLAGAQAATVVDLSACADAAALARRAPVPADPQARQRLAALDAALATARARFAAGRYRELVDDSAALVARARAIAYPPVLAEALLLAAKVQERVDQAAQAEPLLEAAVLAAEAGGDDGLRFDAAIALVSVVGQKLERGDDGFRHAERAQALVTRLGGDPRRAATLALAQAGLGWSLGRYAEAHRAAEAAVAGYQRSDPDSLALARALHMRAIIENEQHDDAAAVVSEAVAIALGTQVLGADHPTVASFVMTQGNALRRLDRLDEARAAYQRALVSLEAFYGPEASLVASALGNLATVHSDLGQFAEAATLLRRTLAINQRALGPDHSQVGLTCELLGSALSKAGHAVEAEAMLGRAVAIHTARKGAASPATASSHKALGQHYLRTDRPARARDAFRAAIAAYDASQGSGDALSARALQGLGDAERALGHPAAAATAYQRATAANGGRPVAAP